MLFNSLAFIVFAAVFFHIWPLISGMRQPKWLFLIIASFIFYGWWDWRFLILIVFTGLIDFFTGQAIYRYPAKKKIWLFISVSVNLAVLGTFKYLMFLLSSLAGISTSLGMQMNIPTIELVLPVGISFYTFQSMSYTIDIYRGFLKPTNNILHYFAYLSLFPQLVAGPIIRAKDLLPQLNENRIANNYQFWQGLKLIIYGYFKKVVIADNLARIVNYAFGNEMPSENALYWWIIIFFFAVQIYCDFSGYSDIAIGLGKWMGYDFPANFNHPYLALSIRDFWSRWHISLTTWFRDYVFLPLGGAFRSQLHGYRNLWITFLLSGLWHGAAWTFVIWGGIHAFFISFEQLTKWPRKVRRIKFGIYISNAFVLFQVLIGWVFFRSQSLNQAIDILKKMFTGGLFSKFIINRIDPLVISLVIMVVLREVIVLKGLDDKLARYPRFYAVIETLLLGLAMVAIIFLRGPAKEFIYFQF